MDKYSQAKRSEVMRRVKSGDTKPEMVVRRLLHGWGYRYRLHRKDLPGRPDIVLPKWKAIVLVHGCFWHQHENCPRSVRPASNTEFWEKKLNRNVARDTENIERLRDAGWRVFVAWECRIKDEGFPEQLQRFFAKLK